MDLEIPPLNIKSLLDSKPLKSRFLARGLPFTAQVLGPWGEELMGWRVQELTGWQTTFQFEGFKSQNRRTVVFFTSTCHLNNFTVDGVTDSWADGLGAPRAKGSRWAGQPSVCRGEVPKWARKDESCREQRLVIPGRCRGKSNRRVQWSTRLLSSGASYQQTTLYAIS